MKIVNYIERHNFCWNDLLTKSNRTEIQTYKVEERTFGTPCIGIQMFELVWQTPHLHHWGVFWGRWGSSGVTKSKQTKHYYTSQLVRALCFSQPLCQFFSILLVPKISWSFPFLLFFFGSTINTFALQFPFSPSVLLVQLNRKHFRQYYFKFSDNRSPYFSLWKS